MTDVAELTGRARAKIDRLVREAGVMRPRAERGSPCDASPPATSLARMDVRPLAARWIDGAEVKALADEREVPPDLLWTLAWRCPR